MKRLHYKRPVGRPRSGKFTRSFFVTDEEHSQLVHFLEWLREQPKREES